MNIEVYEENGTQSTQSKMWHLWKTSEDWTNTSISSDDI